LQALAARKGKGKEDRRSDREMRAEGRGQRGQDKRRRVEGEEGPPDEQGGPWTDPKMPKQEDIPSPSLRAAARFCGIAQVLSVEVLRKTRNVDKKYEDEEATFKEQLGQYKEPPTMEVGEIFKFTAVNVEDLGFTPSTLTSTTLFKEAEAAYHQAHARAVQKTNDFLDMPDNEPNTSLVLAEQEAAKEEEEKRKKLQAAAQEWLEAKEKSNIAKVAAWKEKLKHLEERIRRMMVGDEARKAQEAATAALEHAKATHTQIHVEACNKWQEQHSAQGNLELRLCPAGEDQVGRDLDQTLLIQSLRGELEELKNKFESLNEKYLVAEGDKLRLQIDIKKLEKELESYKQRQQESGLT
jgi:hypothetical protein